MCFLCIFMISGDLALKSSEICMAGADNHGPVVKEISHLEKTPCQVGGRERWLRVCAVLGSVCR